MYIMDCKEGVTIQYTLKIGKLKHICIYCDFKSGENLDKCGYVKISNGRK